MAKQLQLRGGTTAEHASFTGANREVTVDTSKDTVVVHDGSTAGGHPLAKAGDVYTKTEVDVKTKELFIKPTNGVVLFEKTAPASFIIPSGTVIYVNGTTIELTSDETLSLNSDLDTGTKSAGTDYYVYAKSDSSFYISADDSITSDRLIGGFHYGLTTESESTSGNKTEADMVKIRGINAYSFWDLKFYSKAGNKGMFCNGTNWYDIYLADTEYGINGYSRAYAQIAGGGTNYGRGYPKIPLQFGGNGSTNYGKLTPFVAMDLAISANKEMIEYQEFTDIAYGVQEGLSSAEPVTGQTGHTGALTSKYGMEQATGTQWIWSKSFGSSSASGWSDIADSRGQVYSNVYVALLGGGRTESAGVSGSRCSLWGDTLTGSGWYSGLRSRSDLVILD